MVGVKDKWSVSDDGKVDIINLIDWLTEMQGDGPTLHAIVKLKNGKGIAFYLPDNEVLAGLDSD